MTTLEVLKAARELISDEKRWTQREFSRDADGNPLGSDEVSAGVCFCAVGALLRCEGRIFSESYEALSESMEAVTVSYYNDTHTHAEVLAKFDEAIAKLEAA
jgi:hypothetical protein